jgi:segregation and condensation protein B
VALHDREVRDNAGIPITPESIVEAIVFVGLPGDDKLTLKKISSLLRDVSPKEIKAIIRQLNARYEKGQSAVRIKLDGTAVSMELDDSMLPFQQAFSRQNRGVRLNAATIEVLAIIAYNQPITREKIEETRKKASGAIVTQLVRRGLVAPLEQELGAPRQQLVTTEKFLSLFHLEELADLPKGTDVSDLDELLS